MKKGTFDSAEFSGEGSVNVCILGTQLKGCWKEIKKK